MSTAAAFFVSALITLTVETGFEPRDGWTQFIMPFETKEECEEFTSVNSLPLMLQLQSSMGKIIEEFHRFECMTESEAVDANKALGHDVEDDDKGRI
tara:strand:- start:1246 stop:1536 length:291 start_codon:yes stop_codon:yes gene_type:complete